MCVFIRLNLEFHPNPFGPNARTVNERRMNENRDIGIQFGAVKEDLKSEEYPLTKDEILETYGDHELEFTNGSSTVREILDSVGDTQFDEYDQLHQTILNRVGTGAVGRDGYTDRGGSIPDEEMESSGAKDGTSEEDAQDSL